LFLILIAYCTIHPDVLKIGRGLKIGALCGGFNSPLDHDNCDQNYEIKYIDEVLVHPKFRDTWKKENNYALVKLNERSRITPAKLDNGSFASKYEPGSYDHFSITRYLNSSKFRPNYFFLLTSLYCSLQNHRKEIVEPWYVISSCCR
jgi:hypothetical protein